MLLLLCKWLFCLCDGDGDNVGVLSVFPCRSFCIYYLFIILYFPLFAMYAGHGGSFFAHQRVTGGGLEFTAVAAGALPVERRYDPAASSSSAAAITVEGGMPKSQLSRQHSVDIGTLMQTLSVHIIGGDSRSEVTAGAAWAQLKPRTAAEVDDEYSYDFKRERQVLGVVSDA